MSKEPTYEALTIELETIIATLQQDATAIDDAVEQYQRGLALIKQLNERLKTAENKITELKANFSEA